MPEKRPNILLILTDQQRWDTIAALGNPVIRTPHLDRLCAEGTAFTSAFTPSPVCVPGRCSLYWGEYPWNTGVYDNGWDMPGEEKASMFQCLTDSGYRTHSIGKVHFEPKPRVMNGLQTREFQEEMTGNPEADHYHCFLKENGYGHLIDPHGIRGEMYYVPQPAQMPEHLHPTHWVGSRTAAFIEEHKDSDAPWFLFSSYIHPHPPFAPPNPWTKLYRAPLMPLPHVPQQSESLQIHINRFQNRYKYRDAGIDNHLMRNMKAYYYACISFIDYQVGRTLAALEATGQLENTIVLFTSDHGELLGDYNCFGKRSMHDAAMRVPFIARHPELFTADTRCETPVSLVDVMSTCLSQAQAECATHNLDGGQLDEIASGAESNRFVYSHFNYAQNAVYTVVNRDWKYTYSAPDNAPFLFDRNKDPLETRNLSGIPFVSEAETTMRTQMLEVLNKADHEEALNETKDGFRQYPEARIDQNPNAGLLIQDHPWAQTDIPGYSDSAR